MPTQPRALVARTALLLTLALGACGKQQPAPPPPPPPPPPPAAPPPLAVASVTLGSALGDQETVKTPTTSFHASDTIYASVATTGIGDQASLGARWSWIRADGSAKQVNETSESITTTGPAATEFHLAKATPWPKGHYRVVITLGGTAVDSQNFEVR